MLRLRIILMFMKAENNFKFCNKIRYSKGHEQLEVILSYLDLLPFPKFFSSFSFFRSTPLKVPRDGNATKNADRHADAYLAGAWTGDGGKTLDVVEKGLEQQVGKGQSRTTSSSSTGPGGKCSGCSKPFQNEEAFEMNGLKYHSGKPSLFALIGCI